MENIAIGSVFEQLKILQSNLNEISEIVDNLNRSGVIEIRGKSNFAGGIKLNSSDNSKGITIQAPSSFSSNYTLTLPPGLPTAEQVLKSDATGTLSWVDNGGNGGNGGNGITTETDPVFTNHDAYGITQNKIDNWDTSYSWGDHSLEGYLTDAHPVFNITDTDIDNWNRVEGYFNVLAGGSIVYLDGINYLMTPNAEVDQDLHVGGTIFGRAGHNPEPNEIHGGDRIKLVSNDHTATVEIMGSNSTEYRFLHHDPPEVGGAIQLNSFDNSKGITIRAPPPPWSGSSYTLTLPPGLPTAGQVLKSDATGTLSWVDNEGSGDSGGSNGETAYSWGDHSLSGYLTDAHPAHGITQNKIDNWDTAYSWGDHSLSGYLTDAHPAHGVTTNKIDNWDTAYSWGDHSLSGYLTDAHPAHGVTYDKIDNWDTAYSWGNHADQGYLTDAHPASAITASQVSALSTNSTNSTSNVKAETWGLAQPVPTSNSTSISTNIHILFSASFKQYDTSDIYMDIFPKYGVGGTQPTHNWKINGGTGVGPQASITANPQTALLDWTFPTASEDGFFTFKSTGLYMINFDFLILGTYDMEVHICLLLSAPAASSPPPDDNYIEVVDSRKEFKSYVVENHGTDIDTFEQLTGQYIFYVHDKDLCKFKLGTKLHNQTRTNNYTTRNAQFNTGNRGIKTVPNQLKVGRTFTIAAGAGSGYENGDKIALRSGAPTTPYTGLAMDAIAEVTTVTTVADVYGRNGKITNFKVIEGGSGFEDGDQLYIKTLTGEGTGHNLFTYTSGIAVAQTLVAADLEASSILPSKLIVVKLS